MLKSQLKADFQSASDNTIESLKLEQSEWPGEEMFLTFLQIVELNNWNLLDNYGQALDAYFAQCMINDDGSFDTTVYVLTANPEYELVTSNGTFSSAISSILLTKEDSVLISLNSSYKFSYTVNELLSVSWEGNVFNEIGEVIEPPEISLVNNTLVWDAVAYGTIRYSIKVSAYSHTLNVPPIAGATENIFATNVLAFQDKKVVGLEIQPPDVNDKCGDVVLNIITGSEIDDTIPPPDIENTPVPVTFDFFDYCTGEVVIASAMRIDNGPIITDFVTPIMLLPGTYTISVVATGYIDSASDDLANDSFTVTVIPILPTDS